MNFRKAVKMKKLKGVLSAGILLLSTQSFAELQLDDRVSVNEGDKAIIMAYRDTAGCNIWRYVPGNYTATDSFMYDVGLTSTKIGQQSLLAYVSSMDMMVSSGVTEEKLSLLRSKIFAHLKVSTNECQGSAIDEGSIVLHPVLARTSGKVASEDTSYYSEVVSSLGVNSTAYFDPTNATRISYRLDASDPETKKRMSQIMASTQKKPLKLGSTGILVDGILSKIDSTLRLTGKMVAEFESAIKKTNCQVTTSETSLTPKGALGAVVTGGLGGGLGLDQKSVTCSYNLITEFKGGEYKSMVSMDHSKSKVEVDSKPVRIQICSEKGECQMVNLRDYIELQLYTQLMYLNFQVNIQKLTNNTYEVTLGSQGTRDTVFDMSSRYQSRFDGNVELQIPVYAEKISQESLEALESPLAVCARSGYFRQSNLMASYVGLVPLPIDTKCLE